MSVSEWPWYRAERPSAAVRYTIEERPHTKKNSGRIVSTRGRPRVLPSSASVEWTRAARRALLSQRVGRPVITEPVALSIYVYRDRAVGDLDGYVAAVMDALQCSRGVVGRTRLIGTDGIIRDDAQVVQLEARLYLDRARPRVEVVVAPVGHSES